MKNIDLYLEFADLIECDMNTGKIKVDKDIFDDFVPNACINIQFVGTDCDNISEFVMVAEDNEGIFMELLA